MILVILVLSACSAVDGFPKHGSAEIELRKSTDTDCQRESDQTDILTTAEVLQSNGGTNICTVHSPDYHRFSTCLADYVGYDIFMDWFESNGIPALNTSEGCLYPNANIYECIRYFNVPKDVLIELYNENSLPNYNIDLLYNGTAEEVDKYYRSIPEDQIIEEIMLTNFKKIKMNLLLNHLEIFKDNTNVDSYSLIEMMAMTDTSVDSIMKMIEDDRKSNSASIYSSHFNYNFNLFDEKNGAKTEKMIREHSPFYLDCLFCGITPYETRYEQQVAKNKAAS